MPELPDVEVFRRRLEDSHFDGALRDVRVEDDRVLDRLSPEGLAEAVRGQKFTPSRRHGKLMLAPLSRRGALVFHFGMTGSLEPVEHGREPPRYTQVLFAFDDDRRLAFLSRRKLGYVGFAEDPDAAPREQKLGPDALEIGIEAFRNRLSGKRAAVKSALMNQSTLSGIGNVYSDEILFQARLDPKASTGGLDGDAVETLYETMRRVLEQAIALGAGSPDFPDRAPRDWLLAHRAEGERCPRCGAGLKTVKISSRSAWKCPKCQSPSG
jgi:formamidopyrimidine-DNA glycosylase